MPREVVWYTETKDFWLCLYMKLPQCSLSLFVFLLLPLQSIGHPWNALFHFSFLILGQSVGLLGRGISTSQGLYLHRTTQTQIKRAQTFIPQVGFEPTVLVFERAKTVNTFVRPATRNCVKTINRTFRNFHQQQYQLDCYSCRGPRACCSIRCVCSMIIRSHLTPAMLCASEYTWGSSWQ
jgi:hypothetical protein